MGSKLFSSESLFENGNFCGASRRLSGFSLQSCGISTLRDQSKTRKIPIKSEVSAPILTTLIGRVSGWLGREGSNLRMAESKSAALPLGYAPTRRSKATPVYRVSRAFSTGRRSKRHEN